MRYAVGSVRAFGDKIDIVGSAAFHTVIAQRASVQFEYVFASRRLMQSVDVLRDDGGELSRLFEFRKFFMRRVRLYAFDDELFAVKAVKLRGVRVEKTPAEHLLGRIVPLLVIQSVRTSEVGDTAFRRNARSSEKYDRAAFVYHALQFCNRFIEIVIVHSLQYSAFSARRQFRLVGAGRHPRSGQGFLPAPTTPSFFLALLRAPP